MSASLIDKSEQLPLATYGYDEVRLGRERATISAFDQANQAQVEAMGAAYQALRTGAGH